MILHLTFRGYGIGLDLPTTHDNAASTISRLKEGFEDEPAQVRHCCLCFLSRHIFVGYGDSFAAQLSVY